MKARGPPRRAEGEKPEAPGVSPARGAHDGTAAARDSREGAASEIRDADVGVLLSRSCRRASLG